MRACGAVVMLSTVPSDACGAPSSAPRVRAGLAVLLVLLGLGLGHCGDDVSICTDPDGDPPSCEICNNHRDDDLDGDVDCDDSFCDDAAICRDDRPREVVTTTID